MSHVPQRDGSGGAETEVRFRSPDSAPRHPHPAGPPRNWDVKGQKVLMPEVGAASCALLAPPVLTGGDGEGAETPASPPAQPPHRPAEAFSRPTGLGQPRLVPLRHLPPLAALAGVQPLWPRCGPAVQAPPSAAGGRPAGPDGVRRGQRGRAVARDPGHDPTQRSQPSCWPPSRLVHSPRDSKGPQA